MPVFVAILTQHIEDGSLLWISHWLAQGESLSTSVDEFRAVCRQHGLKYCASWSTPLGDIMDGHAPALLASHGAMFRQWCLHHFAESFMAAARKEPNPPFTCPQELSDIDAEVRRVLGEQCHLIVVVALHAYGWDVGKTAVA